MRFSDWWRDLSRAEAAVWSTVFLVFIFVAGIDVGRAIYQASH